MKNLVICLILMGLATVGFAQEKIEELDEIVLTGVNYKYIDALGNADVALPVKRLETKAATFDVKSLDIYEDGYDTYNVSFKIPQGSILAEYDDEGEIISTVERFNDIRLPLAVSNAIVEKYPGWMITGDIYLVTYKRNKNIKKVYKLFLEKEGNIRRVKTDEDGNFI